VLGPKDFGAEGVYLLSGTNSVGDLVFGVDENGNAKFSGDITGSVITGSTLQTATSGRRVIIDGGSNNLSLYNSSNQLIFSTGEQIEIQSNPHNPSVYTEAHTTSEMGVYSKVISNFAFYGEATTGVAIVGSSINSNGVVGSSSDLHGVVGLTVDGRGVYGESTNGPGLYGTSAFSDGVYGISGGVSGVHGVSTTGSSYGVLGEATNPTSYDFYANGAGANYGPFTGAHDSLLSIHETYDEGDIVIATGKFEKSSISNTTPYVRVSDSLSKAAYGVIISVADLTDVVPAGMVKLIGKDYLNIKNTHRRAVVNALGEGQINVCSQNGDFEVGDFICTSDIPGKGMRYDGQDMRYVVAKCMENIKWDEEDSNIKMVACIYMCG
jgi:co-chaperonin GroES (HSP10)